MDRCLRASGLTPERPEVGVAVVEEVQVVAAVLRPRPRAVLQEAELAVEEAELAVARRPRPPLVREVRAVAVAVRVMPRCKTSSLARAVFGPTAPHRS